MKIYVVEWFWIDDIYLELDGVLEFKFKGWGCVIGDGWFVWDFKLGDVVMVWGKVKFLVWVNYIEKVKIDVYWVVWEFEERLCVYCWCLVLCSIWLWFF